MLSTDIASRGVDTRHVKHVILYDFPYSAIDYLHRVGRTARAGTPGKATSFVAKKDRELAKQIEVGGLDLSDCGWARVISYFHR